MEFLTSKFSGGDRGVEQPLMPLDPAALSDLPLAGRDLSCGWTVMSSTSADWATELCSGSAHLRPQSAQRQDRLASKLTPWVAPPVPVEPRA
jgi:hypothetical protein